MEDMEFQVESDANDDLALFAFDDQHLSDEMQLADLVGNNGFSIGFAGDYSLVI